MVLQTSSQQETQPTTKRSWMRLISAQIIQKPITTGPGQ